MIYEISLHEIITKKIRVPASSREKAESIARDGWRLGVYRMDGDTSPSLFVNALPLSETPDGKKIIGWTRDGQPIFPLMTITAKDLMDAYRVECEKIKRRQVCTAGNPAAGGFDP